MEDGGGKAPLSPFAVWVTVTLVGGRYPFLFMYLKHSTISESVKPLALSQSINLDAWLSVISISSLPFLGVSSPPYIYIISLIE